MSEKEELLKRLSDDVFEMDDEDVVEAAQAYIDNDYEALDGIMEGLVDGMTRAGKMYEEEEYFVSDILLCADAMYAGVDVLKPHLDQNTEAEEKVAVIGAGDYALHEAEILRPHAAQVSILTHGAEISAVFPNDVVVHTGKIARIEGDRRVQRIVFADESQMDADGVFLAVGTPGSSELARKLGVLLDDGKVAVGAQMETNVPGIYAAGDCTGGLLQVVKAVHEGAVAGLAAVESLRQQ